MDRTPSRILIVDDHQDTRDLFSLVLSQENYHVVTASTFQDALKETETQQFDLLMLDSRLEDGSGLDLCRSIRGIDENIPILFCSGMASQMNKDEALAAGAQAYLVKPVDISEICETVESLIRASGKDGGI